MHALRVDPCSSHLILHHSTAVFLKSNLPQEFDLFSVTGLLTLLPAARQIAILFAYLACNYLYSYNFK